MARGFSTQYPGTFHGAIPCATPWLSRVKSCFVQSSPPILSSVCLI